MPSRAAIFSHGMNKLIYTEIKERRASNNEQRVDILSLLLSTLERGTTEICFLQHISHVEITTKVVK